mmetsp:Transcript_40054/g.94045  ORF Transcript_40054/g.94045 Transcript_40054/m.94045 type:complete len:602 (-) Transcript_40054:354-2159(-)
MVADLLGGGRQTGRGSDVLSVGVRRHQRSVHRVRISEIVVRAHERTEGFRKAFRCPVRSYLESAHVVLRHDAGGSHHQPIFQRYLRHRRKNSQQHPILPRFHGIGRGGRGGRRLRHPRLRHLPRAHGPLLFPPATIFFQDLPRADAAGLGGPFASLRHLRRNSGRRRHRPRLRRAGFFDRPHRALPDPAADGLLPDLQHPVLAGGPAGGSRHGRCGLLLPRGRVRTPRPRRRRGLRLRRRPRRLLRPQRHAVAQLVRAHGLGAGVQHGRRGARRAVLRDRERGAAPGAGRRGAGPLLAGPGRDPVRWRVPAVPRGASCGAPGPEPDRARPREGGGRRPHGGRKEYAHGRAAEAGGDRVGIDSDRRRLDSERRSGSSPIQDRRHSPGSDIVFGNHPFQPRSLFRLHRRASFGSPRTGRTEKHADGPGESVSLRRRIVVGRRLRRRIELFRGPASAHCHRQSASVSSCHCHHGRGNLLRRCGNGLEDPTHHAHRVHRRHVHHHRPPTEHDHGQRLYFSDGRRQGGGIRRSLQSRETAGRRLQKAGGFVGEGPRLTVESAENCSHGTRCGEGFGILLGIRDSSSGRCAFGVPHARAPHLRLNST